MPLEQVSAEDWKDTPCVFFSGCIDDHGYGNAHSTALGQYTSAHRAVWMDTYGVLPRDVFVLHKCSALYAKGDFMYRKCINLKHLYTGTAKQNTQDMLNQGRDGHGNNPWRGELSSNAVLTDEAVRDIRRRYSEGNISQQALGDEYGVSRNQVNRVVRRLDWRHV